VIRPVHVLAALISLGAAAGVASADGPADRPAPTAPAERDGEVVERAEITVAPPRRPDSVVIENLLGDVKVEGHDGNHITIVSVKHAPDLDTLERLRVTVVPTDGTVRLTTTLADGRERRPAALGGLRIDLVIRVPRTARVDGRTGSGRLEVKNLDAGADLDAGRGAIAVDNVAGRVLARTVDGDQRFSTVFGDLDAHAIEAQVMIDTIRGRTLNAQIYSGRIDAQRVGSRDVHLYAIDGDIRVDATAQPRGTIVVSSLRGKVDVTVRTQNRLNVRARAGGKVTMSGAATAVGRDRWVEGQFGRAGQRSTLGNARIESRYGDVVFSVVE
jgi:hypothetical protein